MTDMTSVIQPKSDQLNFDDFCGGKTLTIKITKVSKVSGEQPIVINYENDNGKPWRPCKSMCRVLVNCWGGNGQSYVGKSLTLYGDPTVKWAGMEVGGIRISHMSDIPAERVMALTTSKSNRKPFTVKPLVVEQTISADDWIKDIESVPTLEGLKHKFSQAQKLFKDSQDFARIHAAKEKRKAELTPKAEEIAP